MINPLVSIMGMKMSITRRDFLNGTALVIAGGSTGTLLSCQKLNQSSSETKTVQHPLSRTVTSPQNYPPQLTKLRGNHQGSFDVAHEMAFKKMTFDVSPQKSIEQYDLVVVGAGISGLSSAFFYQQRFPTHTILILDNHDDFGGHARRNEFHATKDNGEPVFRLSFGGSESIDSPKTYSKVAGALLKSLGIEYQLFEKYYDQEFFKKEKLQLGVFFNQKTFGKSCLIPQQPTENNAAAFFPKTPLSKGDQTALIELYAKPQDYLGKMPHADREAYLAQLSYDHFLTKHVGLPQTAKVFLEDICLEYFGFSIDCLSTLEAYHSGYPGLSKLGLKANEEEEPYIYHFPDGNASIARLLVKKLIPQVVSNPQHSEHMNAMEAIVLDQFDYQKLDQAKHHIRLRLNSTVVQVKNIHPSDSSKSSQGSVMIGYKSDQQTYRVDAKQVILACNSHMIPYLANELPQQQQQDLLKNVKVPMIYGKILVKNWHVFKKLGTWQIYAPKSPYCLVMMDYPVSMGGYDYPKSPDDPVVIHMVRVPVPYGTGLPLRAAYRLGRSEVYQQSYQQLESVMLDQLREIYQLANENLDENILAITINRWGHGYSYEANELFDSETEIKRILASVKHPQGHLHIANGDADWQPYMNGAIDQAWRAVNEIT